MVHREPARIVAPGVLLLPDDVSDERVRAEHFVEEHSEMVYLAIVDTYEENTILAQKLARQDEARQHH